MSNKYFEIDDEGKKLFITQTALKTGLPAVVVEKDLWVTVVLQLVFQLPYQPQESHGVFEVMVVFPEPFGPAITMRTGRWVVCFIVFYLMAVAACRSSSK